MNLTLHGKVELYEYLSRVNQEGSDEIRTLFNLYPGIPSSVQEQGLALSSKQSESKIQGLMESE
jgi:hypothetical protein